MIVRILAISRGQTKLSPDNEVKVRELLDNPTELSRAIGVVDDLIGWEHESIVSLFEDDGTFIRSYEF